LSQFATLKQRSLSACIHVAAKFVGGKPDLGFEADVSGGISIRGADSSHEQPALLSGEPGKSKARDYAAKS
jgi:hypothetical protein